MSLTRILLFVPGAAAAILGAMLVSSLAFAEADASGTAKSPGQMPGKMIDQMMNQEALADAASAIITAESALPKKEGDAKSAGSSGEVAPQGDIDNAVKLAMAKIPDSAAQTASGTATPAATAATANTGTVNENESQQPLFTPDAATAKIKKSSSSSNLWGRMIASLAIVLVVFGGGVYGFKKWPGSKKITARSRMIEVLSQHHLGPKRSIAVVRVAGEACLIGITDQNISILKTLALLDDDVPAAAPTSASEKNFGGKFQETLAATFTRSGGVAKAAATPAAASRAQQQQPQQQSQQNDAPAFYTRSAKAAAPSNQDAMTEDEFTMQGLREIVGQKLKTMREI